ncbi:transcriptional regulator, BadM/Rrf2 family [Rhodomicrobium vannielii ATCC 17100]|uniref:Transcriptional regulator, BadM/Rrf2 family n=1 Tax=Rhodomicrobium vannielii (strain ATCC 17100 / DSM 162 / LMG 4299 / NCIMB 10020 / ATH 3.1.1) TaxID=648757 RepID=E3I4X8_RHOVT|nr:Rrf2 family transcriptional regulator [Rhodomicrobium vannielii]ADP69332.1 transcriptional regulator, BadM/Rrf2 family [Rhodomicrobium vannielii ATCC 17100]
MRLQVATRHAIFSVLELAAQPHRQMSAVDIAEKYAISPNHLAKVLRTLGREGIVDASRGVGGGYRFVGNPKRLTLFDIIAIFEPIGPTTGGFEAGDDTSEGQALRLVMNEIEDTARATLSSITIDTMLKIARRSKGASIETVIRQAAGQ